MLYWAKVIDTISVAERHNLVRWREHHWMTERGKQRERLAENEYGMFGTSITFYMWSDAAPRFPLLHILSGLLLLCLILFTLLSATNFFVFIHFLPPLLSHLLRQGYFLPVSQFADKLCVPPWWESFLECVFASVRAFCTSGHLIPVYICVCAFACTVCVCLWESERDRKTAYFISGHLLPVLVHLRVCVFVCVCVCSPVVTVLKSKLTSPSPCNSICPSARPLGDYRERERGRGM